ncbi:PREDICTED: TRAF3-interacting JNK-activating modulator [Lepidothrix coronata]|uniref:TRAF3-interacting JNK-activating modulator n=1 Tax=Lepidothrix coronata TaxID=321398 RepID=A0A6J0HT75_9PASS|nr:PREDICTED: TRAF3-interacting JNK-activating modulator [Lepidothrix coronata]
MISQPGVGSRPRRRRSGESYEEKCERRQESRENLRGRNNATTCRHLPRAAGHPPHSPRQREFLRRRNLAGEAGRASPRQEPEAQTPPGSSPTVLLQDLWSSPTSPPAQPLWGYIGWFLVSHISSIGFFPQGQLNEDKLKCKLRALENQLQACTQSYSKECVKKILIEMEDQKQTYEQKAKEALQKMLEDKLQTEQQLQNSQVRNMFYTWLGFSSVQSHPVVLSWPQRAEARNEELHRALQSLRSEHAALHLRATALSQDIDLKAQHITAIEDKLQKEQKQKVMLEATVSHLHNLIQNNQRKSQEVAVQKKDQVFTTQTPPLIPAKENQNTLLEHPEEEEGEESLKDEVQKKTSQLTAKENEVHVDTQAHVDTGAAGARPPGPGGARARVKLCSLCGGPARLRGYQREGTPPGNPPLLCLQCWELRSELEALSEEYRSCLSRLRQCRDELNRSHSQRAKRQRGHWIPLLVALTAVAIATFLASYRP